jgi:UDP-N-acetyl-D-mannosaminuronic acid transferase (WecB/TagA/CpsF family)
MMKGICFTFDAFGQWSEHDRSKMKWMMKVGIEWRPSMAGRPKIIGRPATFSLLSSFPPPLSTRLAQPPQLWDKLEGQWPHGLAARPPSLAGRPPLGSPIKGLPRGASSFIP